MRFQHEFGVADADLTGLFRHHEPMRMTCDKHGRTNSRNLLHTQQRMLQQRAVTEELEKLLRVALA
ncbi:hypothetical protein D3C72_2412490 [compost metagenome]